MNKKAEAMNKTGGEVPSTTSATVVEGYNAPRIEVVMSDDDLTREVLYAGMPSNPR